MKLTSASDFSFRLLIYLSMHRDRWVTVTEVAESYGLSHHHLSKLSKTLINDGIVEGKRGREGGMKLVCSPSEISLDRIIKLMEPDRTMVNCQSGIGGLCKILPACKLKGILADARGAFFEVMEKHTLADLVEDKEVAVALSEIFSEEKI